MPAKLTFLVIDMKSLCKHIHLRLGIGIDLVFKSAYHKVKRRILYISAEFSNWHLKRKDLGNMIVLCNLCICTAKMLPSSLQHMVFGELIFKFQPTAANFWQDIYFFICQIITKRYRDPPTG